ncbi:MAG: hypothetical protein RL015_37 [Verrucomicrobiota bacterium]|jgi:hypothetical protein
MMNYAPKVVLMVSVLMAVTLWLFIKSDDKTQSSEQGNKPHMIAHSKGSLQVSISEKPKAESSLQRLEENQKKKTAFNEEMSKVNVNEQRQKITQRMKRNEPRLRHLMHEWGLTEDQIILALDTLHQRTDMNFDALMEASINTPADVGDRSDLGKVKARIAKTQANIDAAKLLAESVLLPMLGRERFDLLNKHEREIEKNYLKPVND